MRSYLFEDRLYQEVHADGLLFYQHEARAEQTLLISEDSCAFFWDTDPEEAIEELIERLFAGYDLVLVEGYKHGPCPKIEVYRHLETRADPLAGEVDVIEVITKEKVALPYGG